MRLSGLIPFLLVLLLAQVGKAAGATHDHLDMAEANRCLRYFSHFESSYHIPPNLLRAIAIAETGVWHKEHNRHVPWPWAINSHGKSYYFSSKQEAIAAVKQLMHNGQRSIDVGCMQINLMYHPKAFRSLEEAFEPRYNIAYAAQFLKSNFERHMSWRNAVAAYHSETALHGVPYAKRVLALWRAPAQQYHYAGQRGAANVANANNATGPGTAKGSYFSSVPRARRESAIFIKVNRDESGADMGSAKEAMITRMANDTVSRYGN